MNKTKLVTAAALFALVGLQILWREPAMSTEPDRPESAGTSSVKNATGTSSVKNATIYDFTAKTLDGKELKLADFKGKVLLVVNTASKCGFTPQYADLEKLSEQYGSKGLAVLGFPCNQFGSQEPGNSSEIANFCQKNYGVTFQMFDKIDVNGDSAHPVYKFLKKNAPGALGSEAIKWNFTKFLVGKDGHVVKRYAPTVKPHEITADIEAQLAK
jgi:glutathione peroxidase